MIDAGTALHSMAFAVLGAGVAAFLVPRSIMRAPDALLRTNVNDKQVPAVLGLPVVAGGVVGTIVLRVADLVGWLEWPTLRMNLAVSLLIVTMFIAGAWDDSRGDERPRGFKGHLGAVRELRLTGGLVKLLAGGVAGLAAGWILTSDLATILEIGALVALSANLVNLFDRAPGRAGKVSLILAIPLVVAGSEDWTIAAAAAIGASIACLPADLGERAMLGDAGANPLGAVLGLGIAVSLEEPGRLVAIALLLALNIASEKWSFSRAIEGSRVLHRVDMWGRPQNPNPPC